MNKFQKWGAELLGIKNMMMPGVALLLNGGFSWGFRTKNSQLTLGYQNKIVYAVVNVLVRKLVEVPIIVSKVKSQKDLARVKTYSFNKGNHDGKFHKYMAKALDELEDHDLITLLDEPNDYQTGIELREAFWMNYELSGDGYLFVETAGEGRREGKPVFLHALNADRVVPYRSGGDWRTPIDYYTYTTWNGEQITIRPEQLMHMSKWSPFDPIKGGLSPQDALGSTIEKNNQNAIAQGAAFRNGSTGTIIGSDSIVADGKQYFKLSKEAVADIKETTQRDWAGSSNSLKTHVTNGHVTVQKLGDTLIDLNAINANKEDVQFIAAGYGMSAILVGDMSGGTDSNVAAAYKALVTNVVVPELRKFDMKFRRFMRNWYAGEKLDVSHDLTEFTELAPDLKLMKEVYGMPNISEDERRKIFNFDEMPNGIGKAILVPSGLQTIESILEPELEIDPNGKQYDYN